MNIALLKKPRQVHGAQRVLAGIAARLAAAQAELDRAANAYVAAGTKQALGTIDGATPSDDSVAELDAARKARDAAADQVALMQGALQEAERRVAAAERADADADLAERWSDARKLALARNAAFDKVERLLNELETASKHLLAVTKQLGEASPRVQAMGLAERQEQMVTQAHRMHRYLDLFTRAFRLEDEFDRNFDFAEAKAGIRDVEFDWSRIAGTRDAEPKTFARTAF